MPTDTLYGLVASALSPEAVGRVYVLKNRSLQKPFIILISSFADLKTFEIVLEEETLKKLQKIWPGKVSFILPCSDEKFSYLHRGTKSLAFRIPDKSDLRELLKTAGPLIAPSANIEGNPPAQTIAEARNYFGGKIDFYIDGGELLGEPSTIIKFEAGGIKIVRPGGQKLET